MKKKLLLLFALAAALLALTACGEKDEVAPTTAAPTTESTEAATAEPTDETTAEPTEEATAQPTEEPTTEPTEAPTAEPTNEPTAEPTEAPTAEPTNEPTAEPTEAPTAEPANEPTAEPTEAPADEETAVIGGADSKTHIVITDSDVATADEPVLVPNDPDDPVLATAYDGEIFVRKSDVQEDYDSLLSSYVSMYTQYGYQVDEYETQLQSDVAQEAVQLDLSKQIVERQSTALGYTLTDEKRDELDAQVQAALDSVREYCESYLAYYGYEGDALNEAVESEMAAGGYTYEALMENALINDQLDFLYDLATADITVTEEEVTAAFDEKVAKAKENYADIDAFINDYMSGEDILYTPEGLRLVESIFIALPEDEATPSEATPEETTPDEATPDETMPDETTPDEATPDEAEDIDALTGVAKANAVLALIRGGMDFDEAMRTYDESGTPRDEEATLYPVGQGSTLYSEEFAAAAMALEHIGDVSDVVLASNGCFILRYADDLASETVTIDSRLEQETEDLLESRKSDAYDAYIEQIIDDAGIVMEDLTPLYHVFTFGSVDVAVAYGQVGEETKLTGKPGEQAVATLSVGTTVDILGHITVDDVPYAFVSIPNTQRKGYVLESVLTETDEATALAADNASLVTAEPDGDALPTFTVVMNDGSIIYGELYPEIAPQSVGNFIDLANSSFYDGLIFHRVIPGFMIQGGDPNGDGTGGPGYSITGEFESNGVPNSLSHKRGVLSMARSSAANSGGSQFFIMHADNDYLDGDYAAFGMVLGGLDTVDVIASVPTNANDRPTTDQTMRTVYVETYGKTYPFDKLSD